MPRKTPVRATRRVRVRDRQRPVRLRPAQPIVSEAGDDAAELGAALSEALGIGSKLAGDMELQQAQDEFQQGIEDFEAGIEDPELAERSESYNRARSQLKARADWAVDKKELEEALRQNGYDDMTEEEVNSFIDEFYRTKYGGYDDPVAVEWLAPRMAKFREEILAGKAARTQAQLKEADGVDLVVSFRDALEENPDDPSEAYSLLSEMTKTLYEKGERNEMYAKVLFDYAIDNGLPELIENMPDKHPGTDIDTIKHIPKYQNAIRDAIAKARAVRANKETELEAQLEDNFEQAKLGVVQLMLAGKDREAEDAIQDLVTMPGADPEDVASLRTRLSSIRDDIEERQPAPDAIVRLEQSIYRGEAGYAQINEYLESGMLGTGQQAAKEASRLNRLVQQVRSSGDSDLNRVVSTYTTDLRRRYNPQRGGPLQAIDATLEDILRSAETEFRQRVYEQGQDPVRAFDEVTEKYDIAAEKHAKTIKDITPNDPLSILQRYEAGTIQLDDIAGTSVDANAVVFAVDRGLLPRDKGEEVIDYLLTQR